VHDPKTWGLLSGKHRFHLRRLVGEWISPFSGQLSQSFALDYLVVPKEISNG
jgi:hypothetical protein